MPRIPLIDPDKAEGRAKELFDGPLKDMRLNIFKAMANAPAVLDAYLGFSGAMKKASLSGAEQEVIALAVSNAAGCDYCQAAHTAIGKNAGLTDEQTLQARKGEPQDPRHKALATFGLALYEKRGWVSDEDIRAFKGAGFDDQQVVEAVGVYAQTTLTNTFNHVAQTPVDFPEPQKV